MTAHLIRGAQLVDGPRADNRLEGRRVTAVGSGLDTAGATVVDADGLIALPGLVDLHTHLREPGGEESETVRTGSRAAAAGGFTAVNAMANGDLDVQTAVD
ncbi:MAG: amidohydrolase family protein, partial [Curtobacterium sp.]